jgi:hypothetical protein
LNDLLNFDWNLLDDLFSGSDLNNLVNVFFDDFMNFDQMWNNSFKLDDLVLFNEFFNDLLDFNDSWNLNN